MPGKYSLQMNDYGGEKSSASVPTATLSSANYDAQAGLMAILKTAVEGVTIGVASREIILGLDSDLSSANPVDPFAQRETKWLVTMSGDTSGRLYQREIPTADLAFLAPGTEDMIDGIEKTALVSALENLFYGDQGESVTVLTIKFVARNL